MRDLTIATVSVPADTTGDLEEDDLQKMGLTQSLHRHAGLASDIATDSRAFSTSRYRVVFR